MEGLTTKIRFLFKQLQQAMMYFAALLIFGSIVEFTTAGVADPQCSPVPCDTDRGCRYVPGSPCAKCECPGKPDVGNSCSMPKCSEDCPLNKYATPCPVCDCGPPKVLNRRRRHVHCTPPSCSKPCNIIYPEGSCPYCDCPSNPPDYECSPPKCDDPGCYIDYSTQPCPTCICNKPSSEEECAPPRCENGCILDYSTPCPSCQCNNPPSVQCDPPVCNKGCVVDYNTQPCPSCKCNNDAPSQWSGAVASANSHSQKRGYYGR